MASLRQWMTCGFLVVAGIAGIFGNQASAEQPNGNNERNWTAPLPVCNDRAEWLKADHLSIGVAFGTANPTLLHQFKRALDYWSRIIDLDWRAAPSPDCALGLYDGPDNLFYDGIIARSQFPEDADFQGWIVFASRDDDLTPAEYYYTSIHEIGHMLGLPHSASNYSVMSLFTFDGKQHLDRADLDELAKHHSLRRR